MIGVVIPVRNRKAKTLRFLERLAQQTCRDISVYVVDSNSTDGTQAAIALRFPAVTILSASDRDYWAGATNRGIQAALARPDIAYILTINDDSLIPDDFIETLNAIAKRYRTDILGVRIDLLAAPGIIWSIGSCHKWGSRHLFITNHGRRHEDTLPPMIREAHLLPVESMPGNGVLIRREIFARLGLYNTRFTPHYHADTEFMLRARAQGVVPFVTPQVILYNDFEMPQIPPRTNIVMSLIRFGSHLFNTRSNWYLPAHLYIIYKYCPRGARISSLYYYLREALFAAFSNTSLQKRVGLSRINRRTLVFAASIVRSHCSRILSIKALGSFDPLRKHSK